MSSRHNDRDTGWGEGVSEELKPFLGIMILSYISSIFSKIIFWIQSLFLPGSFVLSLSLFILFVIKAVFIWFRCFLFLLYFISPRYTILFLGKSVFICHWISLSRFFWRLKFLACYSGAHFSKFFLSVPPVIDKVTRSYNNLSAESELFSTKSEKNATICR